MRENVSLQSPILFFISRFLILAGMVLTFYFVFMGVGMLLVKPLFGISITEIMDFSTNPAALRAVKFLQVLVTAGAFIIPAWYFPKALQQDSKEFLQVNTTIKSRDIGFAIALMLCCMPLTSWLVNFNEHISFPEPFKYIENYLRAEEDQAAALTKAFIKTESFGGLMLNMFVVALIPAVSEELLFRGTLQKFFSFCFGNIHVAVWSGAIIFSAFHMQFFGFFPRMILGALLGYLFAYTGSLWIAVIAHFINNALALLANYYKWDEDSSGIFKDDYVFPFYIILLSFALCSVLIYLMHQLNKTKRELNGE